MYFFSKLVDCFEGNNNLNQLQLVFVLKQYYWIRDRTLICIIKANSSKSRQKSRQKKNLGDGGGGGRWGSRRARKAWKKERKPYYQQLTVKYLTDVGALNSSNNNHRHHHHSSTIIY